MDLAYRAEILGITQAELARLLGRSQRTIVRWCSTSLEHPPWLIDWMEYVEMELSCGCAPEPLPRGRKAIEALLYPSRVKSKRRRRPNGSRSALLEARSANRTMRQQRKDNQERMRHNLMLQQPPMDPLERVERLRNKNNIKTS